LVCLSASFPNSHVIPFWESHFLPFSVIIVIYLTLLSLLYWFFSPLHKFLYWLIFSNFLFHCHILGPKFFSTVSFQKCLFAYCLCLLVSKSLMHMLKFCLLLCSLVLTLVLDISVFLKNIL
jgi:hypothetical protein